MHVTRAVASARSKKGWQTRRRHGSTRITTTHWHRPNGDKIRLKGFTYEQLQAISPALEKTDRYVKPDIHLTKLKKIEAKRPGLEGVRYRMMTGQNPRKMGAVTKVGAFSHKAEVRVNPYAFKKRSPWNPEGLVAHEIGHVIGPEKYAVNKEQMKHFSKSFGWTSPRNKLIYSPERWKMSRHNILKDVKTRQSTNADEDFAETYRTSLGLHLGKTNRRGEEKKYFRTAVDSARMEHLNKYYLQ